MNAITRSSSHVARRTSSMPAYATARLQIKTRATPTDETGQQIWSEAKERSEKFRKVLDTGLGTIHDELKATANADLEKIRNWFVDATTSKDKPAASAGRRKWTSNEETIIVE